MTSLSRFQTALAHPTPRRVASVDPITVTKSGAPTIPSYVGYDAGDTKVRYLHGAQRPAGDHYPLQYFLSLDAIHPEGAGATHNYPASEIVTDSRYVEFDSTGGPANYAIFLDGELTNPAGYAFSNGLTYVKLDMGSAGTKHRIRFDQGGAYPGGVKISPDGTLYDPAPAYRCNAMVFGDSIGEGTGASLSLNGFVPLLMERLGIDNAINSCLGGTGYVNPGLGGRVNLRDRIALEVELVPQDDPQIDVIFFFMGLNDVAADATFAANVAYSLNAARTRWPDAVIIASGPLHGFDGGNDQYAKRDVIRNACPAYGVKFIDTEGWLTIADTAAYFPGGYGDPHPNDAGHAYYAQKFDTAIRALMADPIPSSPAPGVWTVTTPTGAVWTVIPPDPVTWL